MTSHHANHTGARPLLLICLCSLLSQQAMAATASRAGGSGMSWMRTADTLANGELTIYDQLGIDSYEILNSNLNDYDTFNTLGINYGLFNPLELGIQTTYMSNDQHKTSGLRAYKGIMKLRVLGNDAKDNYGVAISAYTTSSPADPANKIGSGETESGAEINISYYIDDMNLHLTLGSATTDAKYYDPDVVYYSVDKQYANIGLEFKVSERFIFGIEAVQEQAEDPMFDKNQIFAFSLQYKSSRAWDFDFGAAFGVPEDRTEPGKSFYVGFNFHPGTDDRHGYDVRPAAQTAPVHIPAPQAEPAPRPQFSQQPKPIDTPPEKPKRAEAAASYKYRVVLKNATGSKATGDRVKEFLQQNGYGVVSVQSISRRDKTEIRYLGSNSKQALRLALKLPGNQDLRQMSSLEKGVDFELVIGSDIIGNI